MLCKRLVRFPVLLPILEFIRALRRFWLCSHTFAEMPYSSIIKVIMRPSGILCYPFQINVLFKFKRNSVATHNSLQTNIRVVEPTGTNSLFQVLWKILKQGNFRLGNDILQWKDLIAALNPLREIAVPPKFSNSMCPSL